MRRPKPVRVVGYSEESETPVDPPQELHRHTNYARNPNNGGFSVSRSVLSMPTIQASGPSNQDVDAGDDYYPSQGDMNFDFDASDSPFPFAWMDPTYKYELKDITDDPKRSRSVAVVGCSTS